MTALISAQATFVRHMARMGVDVSRETADQLQVLVDTLARWQKSINLVGRTTLEDVWTRHVLDSAQLVSLIPDSAETLVDLGSGGGFPGLVIAALAPRLQVTLVEADARKAAFLGEASRRMGLERAPTIRIGRIEAVEPARSDVITARALAPLAQLLAWAARHRGDTTICLFHKGKGWQAELTEAMKTWDISLHPSDSITHIDAVILRIGHFSPRGTAGT
jgi:16S rRNA (guanine527-N7)-methyltransferase